MSGTVLFQDDAVIDAVACQEYLQLLGPVYGAEVFFFSDLESVCYLLDRADRSCVSRSGPRSPSVASCLPATTTEGGGSLDCDQLCAEAAGADGAGDCCASEGCDCSDNSLVTCEENHYFCPALGVCADFTDEDACEAAADIYCC